ncbi:hypothetical protein [Paenibacillus sp. FSL R10-2736]
MYYIDTLTFTVDAMDYSLQDGSDKLPQTGDPVRRRGRLAG